MFYVTMATSKLMGMTKRLRCVPGGTSAGKTIGVLEILIDKAQRDKVPTLTSIVSESFPHLRRGALRDFKNIMMTQNYWKDDNWNATESIYTFETKAIIEFFSVDQPDKLRGARRDRLFINEANNIPFDAFEQLEVRTKDFVFLDWNPSSEFWYYTEIKGQRDDAEEVVLTYKDNEALSPEIIASIEQRKHRKGWWNVYGLGMLGEVEGKIYKDWEIIDEIPHTAKLLRRGLDFGYSQDPCAIVDIYSHNGGFVLDEILYEKFYSNKKIADFLRLQEEQVLTIADSSEPKSIDELKGYGINIIGAVKGPGSINQGIAFIQDQKISITRRSANGIREYRNYLWMTDKNGKILDQPEGGFDHCFAPETLVHTTEGRKRIDELVGKTGKLYSINGEIKPFHSVRATRKNTEVISLELADGEVLTVTPDHLLLTPKGEWRQADCFVPKDRIQSAMYDYNYLGYRTGVSRNNFQTLQWRKLLQKAFAWTNGFSSSCCLAVFQWLNSERLSHSPQGSQPRKQRVGKLGVDSQVKTLERTHDSRASSQSCKMGRKDKTTNKGLARFKRGKSVAQDSWSRSLCEEKTSGTRVRSLSQKVRNFTVFCFSPFLSLKLQNACAYKTITRITRGRRAITYNLEVEGTHCLLANGVIAHNCLDATRYGFNGKIGQENLPTFGQSKPNFVPYGKKVRVH